MCRSMVDIQSATSNKKEERRKKPQDENIMSASATQGGHNKSSVVAEMGGRGHNRYGPKRGGTAVLLSRGECWVPV